MRVETDIHIAAPPEAVHDHFADPARIEGSLGAVTRVEILSAIPAGLGARWRETRMIFGREGSEEMEITAAERPGRIAVSAASHGAAYETVYTFTPEAGGTRVRVSFAGRAETIGARIMAALLGLAMAGSVRRMLARDLADRKAAIEGRVPA